MHPLRAFQLVLVIACIGVVLLCPYRPDVPEKTTKTIRIARHVIHERPCNDLPWDESCRRRREKNERL